MTDDELPPHVAAYLRAEQDELERTTADLRVDWRVHDTGLEGTWVLDEVPLALAVQLLDGLLELREVGADGWRTGLCYRHDLRALLQPELDMDGYVHSVVYGTAETVMDCPRLEVRVGRTPAPP